MRSAILLSAGTAAMQQPPRALSDDTCACRRIGHNTWRNARPRPECRPSAAAPSR